MREGGSTFFAGRFLDLESFQGEGERAFGAEQSSFVVFCVIFGLVGISEQRYFLGGVLGAAVGMAIAVLEDVGVAEKFLLGSGAVV